MTRLLPILLTLAFLWGTPAFAQTTFYVTKAGNDSNTCTQAQTEGTAKLTIAAGLGCMSGGDTLIIGDGVYVESIAPTAIPAGTGASGRTVIQGESHAAIIRPSTGNSAQDAISINGRSWIDIVGLYVDGENVNAACIGLFGSLNNVRIIGNIIEDCGNNPSAQIGGVDGARTKDGNQHTFLVADNIVRNHGSNGFSHCVYFRAGETIIENNELHGCSGFGIRTDRADGVSPAVRSNNNIFRGNRIYGNRAGINIAGGDNIQAYNNLIYDNTNTSGGTETLDAGIRINNGQPENAGVYNNTIVANGTWGILSSNGSHTIRGNLLLNNPNAAILDQGTSTVSGNMCDVGEGCDLSSDTPGFVDLENDDYRLASAMVDAVDVCPTIASVTNDFDGVSRPQGAAYDCGAYEFSSGGGGGTPTRTSVATDAFTTETTQAIDAYSANWKVTYHTAGQSPRVNATNNNVEDPGEGGTLALLAVRTDGGWSNDQYSEIAVTTLPTGTNSEHRAVAGVRGSQDTDAGRDGYLCSLYTFSAGTGGLAASIQKIVNGTRSTLLNVTNIAWMAGDTLECEVIGTTITMLRNGSSIGNTSDSTFTTGKPFIGVLGTGVIDDFDGGNFSEPAPQQSTFVISSPSAGNAYTRTRNDQATLEWTPEDASGTIALKYGVHGASGLLRQFREVAFDASPQTVDLDELKVPASTELVLCIVQDATTECTGEMTLRGSSIR